MIVYKITNLVNGKLYIGITTQSLEKRFQSHLSCMRAGDSRHLYCAMRKYGVHNFKIEVIERVNTYSELLEKEKYYIAEYDTIQQGYNMTAGGEDNPMSNQQVIKKHDDIMRSDTVRKKISQTMKAKAMNGELFKLETKEKLSQKAKEQVYFHKENKVTHTNYKNTSRIQELLQAGWIMYDKKTNVSTTYKRKRKPYVKRDSYKYVSKDGPVKPNAYNTRQCYCLINDEKFIFNSYREAAEWWYYNYKPFGDSYAECTYVRKIKKSIAGEPITYKSSIKKLDLKITNIHWYLVKDEKGSDVSCEQFENQEYKN